MFRFAALTGVVFAVFAIGASSGSPLSPVANGRIAFASHSDLFTIRPGGSGLRRVTTGPSSDEEPAWSPDGRWLAFSGTSRDRKLTSVYVVKESGGAPRLLVRGARSPSWSPTGRRLAVLRSGTSCRRSCPSARDLWTVGFEGGKPRLASAGAWSGDWSRSGRELAVMRADGIWIVSLGSAGARHLSSVRGRPGSSLDWSPDSEHILFVTNNSVVTISTVDGSLATVVPAPPAYPEQCSPESLARPTWSPDGRWIAYEDVRCVREGDTQFLRSTIPIVTPEGMWRHELDNMVWGENTDFGLSDADWSPDSRFLAFVDEADSTGQEFLETASLSGNYERLKEGVSAAPAWQRP